MSIRLGTEQFGFSSANALKIDEMFGAVAIRYVNERTEKAVKYGMSLSGGFLVTYVEYKGLTPFHKLAKKFDDYHSAAEYAEILRSKKGTKFNYYSLNIHPDFLNWVSKGAEGIPYSLNEYGKVGIKDNLDDYEMVALDHMKKSTVYQNFDALIGKVGYYNARRIRGIENYHAPAEVYGASSSGIVTATVKWGNSTRKVDQAKMVEFIRYESPRDLINCLFISRIVRAVRERGSDDGLPVGLYSDYHSLKRDGLIKMVGNNVKEICKFAKISYSEYEDNICLMS